MAQYGCTCGCSVHVPPCPWAGPIVTIIGPAASPGLVDLPPIARGWICPACGAGLAPAVMRCPCVPIPPPKVDYTTGTTCATLAELLTTGNN